MTPCPDVMPPGRQRILFVATKPAFPPRDGGRLLMWNTIEMLAERGHSITFVAPTFGQDEKESRANLQRHCEEVHLIPARTGILVPSLVRALCTGRPLSIVRHTHRRLQRRIAEVLERGQFDVLHAEQIHSLANLPDSGTLPPVVVRTQNVESQLWRMLAQVKPRVAWLTRRESRRMAAYEAGALNRAATTIALTEHDGTILGGALGMAAKRIRTIPPPFPASLEKTKEAIAGDPAIVLLAGGWLPNKDSTRWFFADVWREIVGRLPTAQVHVFGERISTKEPSATWQRAPDDSIEIFRQGAILVVPLRVASGIRMKILEAWARGVPVVATPEAARGLDGVDGRDFLLACNRQEFANAIERLHREPELGEALVANGRTALATRYDPQRVVSLLEQAYLESTERRLRVS